jgi:hypothetical protein
MSVKKNIREEGRQESIKILVQTKKTRKRHTYFALNFIQNLRWKIVWIMCAHCKGWAHEACAGVEPDDDEIFICDFCQ